MVEETLIHLAALNGWNFVVELNKEVKYKKF